MKVELIIPGAPTSKGRPRFTRKGFAFTPAKTRQAEQTLAARCLALLQQEPDRAAWPSKGALELQVTFTMATPTSMPAWKRALAFVLRFWPIGRPDLDNLVKLTKDALNGVLWVDDAQVVRLIAEKRYGEAPTTHIVLQELEHQVERN